MCLILTGKQGGKSKHPCPWCESDSSFSEAASLSTIGSLHDWYNLFMENGAEWKHSKDYKNVTNPPLITGEDDTLMLDILFLPELHIMTGVTEKILKAMEKLCFSCLQDGDNFLDDFFKRYDIKKTVYRGGMSFEGNQARKVLKSVDKLERDIQNNLDFGTVLKCLPFTECLRKFDKVIDSCFGQELDDTFEEKIAEFSSSYRSLDISITTKVHVVETHIVQFLRLKSFVGGLGFFSEQANESVHHDFKLEWEKVKVSQDNPEYMTKLLNTVVRYASKHI